ncbi:MAG TPA: hypothetical protein DIC51_06475 [Coxiellaceae bacterium]|nr:hypothetical protein [Coxiellaceae bacterium]
MSIMPYLNKNFWILRFSELAALFGNQLALIAISFYVLNHGGHAIQISYIFMPAFIMGLVCSLVLAPLADQCDRKHFIIIGSFFKSIAWLVIVFFIFTNKTSVFIFSGLFMLSGVGGAMITAGSSGFLPDIVDNKQLQKAFQVITGTDSIIKILGGSFAGTLVGFLGIPVALCINFLAFLSAGCSVIFIKPFNSKKNLRLNQFSWTVITNAIKKWPRHFFQGFSFMMQSRSLVVMVFALVVLQFIISPLQIALPLFVKMHLKESSRFLGFLMSAEGVGAILSSIMLGKMATLFSKDAIITMGFVMTALGILTFSLHLDKWIYLFSLTLASMGINLSSMIFNSALMSHIQGDYRSRFFTLLFFIENSMVPVSLILAGYLIDKWGVSRFFSLIGFLLLLVSLLFFYHRTFQGLQNISHELIPCENEVLEFNSE